MKIKILEYQRSKSGVIKVQEYKLHKGKFIINPNFKLHEMLINQEPLYDAVMYHKYYYKEIKE